MLDGLGGGEENGEATKKEEREWGGHAINFIRWD